MWYREASPRLAGTVTHQYHSYNYITKRKGKSILIYRPMVGATNPRKRTLTPRPIRPRPTMICRSNMIIAYINISFYVRTLWWRWRGVEPLVSKVYRLRLYAVLIKAMRSLHYPLHPRIRTVQLALLFHSLQRQTFPYPCTGQVPIPEYLSDMSASW